MPAASPKANPPQALDTAPQAAPRKRANEQLTATQVLQAKPRAKPYKLADGKGLYLLVNTSGSKLWRFKYRFSGEKLMALGGFPDVSLKQARQAHSAARKLLADGTDPMAQRQEASTAKRIAHTNSFAAVAKAWWQSWSANKSERHAGYAMRRLEADVFPAIGATPVSEVEAQDVVAMIKAIEARGAKDIARRAHQMCGQVMRYAIAHGLAKRNPVIDVKPGDVLAPRKQTNYARIDAKELPALLRAMAGCQGSSITRLAMQLMSLTFVRTSELIGAKWEEFDLTQKRWNIPAERMKMRTPHVVPLSEQALEVLATLHVLTGRGELLFPGERNPRQPMSNNTILAALKRMGYAGRMTGHGFRGLASTILHEQGFDHTHIELQLAHQERDAVSAAYNYATYLAPRTKMMQWWADHLDKQRRGAEVIQFKAA